MPAQEGLDAKCGRPKLVHPTLGSMPVVICSVSAATPVAALPSESTKVVPSGRLLIVIMFVFAAVEGGAKGSFVAVVQ